jgi:hypothetical protein
MGDHRIDELDVPESLYASDLRPGYGVVSAVPYAGERVFVTPAASVDVRRPFWIYVESTQDAAMPGFVFVVGRALRGSRAQDRCRLYCRIGALRVERANFSR